MMDIDYFKKINDSFGHMAGDEVIRNLSEILLTTFRTDVVGRMGGEEFAVVMLNTDSQQAYIKTEYFRQAVEKNIIIFEQHKLRVTVSIGVAEFNDETPDFDALLNTADSAMYEAKCAGRNCTVIV